MYLHVYLRANRGKLAAGWRILLLLPLFAGNMNNSYSAMARPDLEQKSVESSLLQWAKDNQFVPAWTPKDGLLKLTSHSTVLSFKVDSMLAEINGVHVWLSEPIALRRGQPFISCLDLRETIEPILFPQTNQPITTVCLDPGHGGKDTGGVFGNYMEKQYTLPLAEELGRQLKTAGFEVMLTRTNDTFVELADRPGMANRQKANLFISLHFNIGPPGLAKGVEVYCLSPAKSSSTNDKGRHKDAAALPGNGQDAQNVLLAYELQKSLASNLGVEDRGMRRARFEVLRSAQMPAVLIEGGFLSDSDERKKIADPQYRTRLATAILQGIVAYQRLTVPARAPKIDE